MNSKPPYDHSLLIFLFALFLFNSPLREWWSGLALPWYTLYLPWLVVIVLVAINQMIQNSGD